MLKRPVRGALLWPPLQASAAHLWAPGAPPAGWVRVGIPCLGPAAHGGVRGRGQELCVNLGSGLRRPSAVPDQPQGLPATAQWLPGLPAFSEDSS